MRPSARQPPGPHSYAELPRDEEDESLEESATSRSPLCDELADDGLEVIPPTGAKWYVWYVPRRWYVPWAVAALLLAAVVAAIINMDACARQGPEYGWLCWEPQGSTAVDAAAVRGRDRRPRAVTPTTLAVHAEATKDTSTTSARSTSTASAWTPTVTATARLARGQAALPRAAGAPFPARSTDPAASGAGGQGQPGTLFCFCLMWLGGEEHALLAEQLRRGVGVFGCDDFGVYTGGSKSLTLGLTPSGSVVATLAVPDLPLPHAKDHHGEGGLTTRSWLNVPTWVRLWTEVGADRRAAARAWTVKVDPDAVVLPGRLRAHLAVFDASRLLYVRSADCFGEELHVLGALEVLSSTALEVYTAGIQLCYHELPWSGWSEDYFTEHCLLRLGVDSVEDLFLVSDKSCHHAVHSCIDQRWAAYHPLTSTWDQNVCVAQGLSRGAKASVGPGRPPRRLQERRGGPAGLMRNRPAPGGEKKGVLSSGALILAHRFGRGARRGVQHRAAAARTSV
ncbi:unnamed protein product [Prorocentrum cordatum]|uniref:Hexosyltransferase n=1 Tax=Prorocentrum cordatum TaxID=2364126 RepID=A0ABN9XFP5_9DINO|nr:unnamed protein product [Polarella glacialis]